MFIQAIHFVTVLWY